MTPRRITVEAVVFNGRGDLLLVPNVAKFAGWNLPGGTLEENETVEEALLRHMSAQANAIWPPDFEMRLARLWSEPTRSAQFNAQPLLTIVFCGVVTDRVQLRPQGGYRPEWVHDWERQRLAWDYKEIAQACWAATGLERGPIASEQPLPAILPDVTYKQRTTLQDLYTGLGAYKAETNPTMKALEKKGLVALQKNEGTPHWTITQLGRAVISG